MLVATFAIIGALAPTLVAVVRNAESAAATAAMTIMATQINTMIITDLGGTGGYTYFSANGANNGTRVNLLVSAANDYPDDEIVPDKYWKGAYLTAPINPDPWGNRYMVNVQYIGASTNDVVVLSAGPDEEIDTAFTANPVTAGDDDLISLVES